MKRIVFLTGAGMSAESGISTFRDSDGLWEHYSVEEICTHEAWLRTPEKLLDFYNMLRRKYMNCKPNRGHELIASLQDHYEVEVITQNLDNLHEQAGTKHVLHLHGEMMKCRGEQNENVTYPLDPANPDIHIGDKDPYGYQLRPHIVFFGEGVPNITPATELMRTADIVVVIGTSLNVYPAAGLLSYAPTGIKIYVIDPKDIQNPYGQSFTHIKKGASEGMKELVEMLRCECADM